MKFSLNFYREVVEDRMEMQDAMDLFFDFTVTIYATTINEDFEEVSSEEIGFITARLLDVKKDVENGYSLIELADSFDNETANAIFPLIDCEMDDIKEEYRTEGFEKNILYLDKLYIYPDQRGKGYARRTLEQLDKITFNLLPGDYVCSVMQPAAFDDYCKISKNGITEITLKVEDEIPNGKERTQQLRSFYQSVGFKPIPNTNILCRIHNID